MFGKRRLAGASYAPLAPTSEAEVLAAHRRALVLLHRRGATSTARSKLLHASLLTHPLCWSNRAHPPMRLPAPAATASETPVAQAAPRQAPSAPAVPHHAQRPALLPVGSWNGYLPGRAPGQTRSHGAFFLREHL